MLPLIAAGIGAAATLGSAWWQTNQAEQADQKNLALQREVFEYQKNLQNTMMQREDTATQRRAVDLQKAGLSKTLAAGGAASAGPVVPVTAPQDPANRTRIPNNINSVTSNVLASMATKSNIAATQASTALAQEQAKKVNAETLAQNEQNKYAASNASLQNLVNISNMNIADRNNWLKELDVRVKEFQISLQDIERQKALIAVNAAQLGLNDQQVTIAAKQAALQNVAYNQDYMRNLGLPMDQGLTPDLQKVMVGTEVLKKGYKAVTGK